MPATTTRSTTTKNKTTRRSTAGTKTTTTRSKAITHEDIAHKAYELWLAKGQPQGQDEQIWYEAETALRSPAKRTRTKRAA